MEIGIIWLTLGSVVLIVAYATEKLNARVKKLEEAIRELNPGLNI